MRNSSLTTIVRTRRARVLRAPAGPLGRMGFTPEHWEALHPKPKSGGIYHSTQHSLNASMVMEQLAREYFPDHVRYLAAVAGLHDIDPYRLPGTPARVQATIDWMQSRRKDLRSCLRWSEMQFDAAKVIIMRTEYPLDSMTQVNSYRAVYERVSPRQHYRDMLVALPPGQRSFALRAGAVLSEYADKASWYLEDHKTAQRMVQGLADEMNRLGGSNAINIQATHRFITMIGSKECFAIDDRIAGELELKGLHLPLIDEVLMRFTDNQRKNFRDNIAQFGLLEEQGTPESKIRVMDGGRRFEPRRRLV